ncbi:hypothetical protein [Piscibacillus salipiscarius]|uniref:hypothetical protein n=1 Tax=Piscibacillus salipiscarius TaxID=299480 RepID=UPI0006D03DA1|nr:hypothetical protein [Piscibacillus salipiscarius]
MTSLLLTVNLTMKAADDGAPSIQTENYEGHQISLTHKSNKWGEAEGNLEDGEQILVAGVRDEVKEKETEKNQMTNNSLRKLKMLNRYL